MLYVYCSRPSSGARDLIGLVGGNRLRQFDGKAFFRRGKKVRVGSQDKIVCWGDDLPEFEEVEVLNGGSVPNKYKSALILANNGIPTIETLAINGSKKGYVGRMYYHVGGNDLLSPPARPDFWVKPEKLVKEYRIHSFLGRSIRAGVKVPREGISFKPHEWVRSYDGGWKINYDDFKSNGKMRKIAAKAVKALGIEFGAVDLGEKEDGTYMVLEVNRAPGLEGGSIEAYAASLKKWSEGTFEGKDVDLAPDPKAKVGVPVQPPQNVVPVEEIHDVPAAAAPPLGQVTLVAVPPQDPDLRRRIVAMGVQSVVEAWDQREIPASNYTRTTLPNGRLRVRRNLTNTAYIYQLSIDAYWVNVLPHPWRLDLAAR